MATILDIGILEQFSDIFAWIFLFVILYGVLEVANLFKNKGLHALLAISATIVIGITSGTANVVTDLLPWFVVTGFFVVFLVILAQFVGINIHQTFFGGSSGIWWLFVPLIVGLVISLVSSGEFSRTGTEIHVDPETGEEVEVSTGQTVVGILTEPKVLGMILLLAISAVTVAIMAGGGPPIPGGH